MPSSLSLSELLSGIPVPITVPSLSSYKPTDLSIGCSTTIVTSSIWLVLQDQSIEGIRIACILVLAQDA